jgi:light-regulated signal transduction histidine kinase (bacteriophytochrome)
MGDTRIVAAHDAWTNPHTREFTEAYFKPAGITSMLDVFIRVCGAVVGVVCHEHVGPMRQWTLEEQEFAASVADLVSIKLEAFGHKQAEESMKELNGELEQAVKKLEDTNQELKNFVYIASHDLREPLRKISAFGSMVQKSLSGKIDGDDAENLNFMIDGANRMTKMIEGLLLYSRVSSKAHFAEAVDLNDIVKEIGQLELSVLLEEKHTTIDVPQPLPEVDADPVRIRQLLQNLIANGMKYQAKDNVPHITLTSQPAANGMVRINITDNGIGIKPEFQQAIFIMFKRLHSKNEYEGTGIGLAVCKKIVERNGGKIGVESEFGKGSTFWFTVPAAKTVMDNTELVQNSQKELL